MEWKAVLEVPATGHFKVQGSGIKLFLTCYLYCIVLCSRGGSLPFINLKNQSAYLKDPTCTIMPDWRCILTIHYCTLVSLVGLPRSAFVPLPIVPFVPTTAHHLWELEEASASRHQQGRLSQKSVRKKAPNGTASYTESSFRSASTGSKTKHFPKHYYACYAHITVGRGSWLCFSKTIFLAQNGLLVRDEPARMDAAYSSLK